MHLSQSREDIGALGQVERGDDLVLFHPLVDAKLVADIAALQNHKLLIEFLLEFALPLEREVGRTDHQNPLDEASQLEFSHQETSHDGLARASIVS